MIARISTDDLRPGDVLLSVGIGPTSEAIRAFDGGLYSHAALFTGDAVIESTTPDVVKHTLDESLTEHARRWVDVYRHKAIAERGVRVAAAAQRFVGRKYGFGDLALTALVAATTAWLPSTRAQEQALLRACDLTRFLELRRDPARQLVTCTELVARAFFEAEVPIRVIPEGAQRIDGAAAVALFGGVVELAQAAKRSVTEAAIHWDATQGELLDVLTALSDGELTPGDVTRAAARALAAMIAGREWAASLVTPRYLERSPDLALVGHLTHPALPETSSAPAGA